MNEKIEALLANAEGRYLEATEQSVMTDFAFTLEQRLRAMRSIQQHEANVVKATMDALWEKYPDMKTRHVDGYKKGTRDLTLVLRYNALAMVRDSVEFLDQKLLFWFRTIISAFEMNEPLQFAYQQLSRELQNHLDGEDFKLVEPFISRTLEILASGEERAAAE